MMAGSDVLLLALVAFVAGTFIKGLFGEQR